MKQIGKIKLALKFLKERLNIYPDNLLANDMIKSLRNRKTGINITDFMPTAEKENYEF